jgi:hypothetical protein
MSCKELKAEKKMLEKEIGDYYRIFNFLTEEQEDHLKMLFARLQDIEDILEEIK